MDTTALTDQALASADEIIAEYASESEDMVRASLRCLLGIAWVEGRQAGGAEASALIREFARGLGDA
jgi:hypothetical protein